MAPSIAFKELGHACVRPLRVLDPMAGSGTTLVVARLCGHLAYGFDTDPLALLISDVWISDINPEHVREEAREVIDRARSRFKIIKQSDAYPEGADEETKEFVRYWFDPINRRQLRSLAESIGFVNISSIQKILWCAFSRLIIAKKRGASLAMDLSHSRPHKVNNRSDFRPILNYHKAVETVISNSPFVQSLEKYPKANISQGDARCLPLPDCFVDIVITSPPYLNAIDYLRCHKFSLIWMGRQIDFIRRLRASNIGSEASRGIQRSTRDMLDTLGVMGDIDDLIGKNRRILIRYLQDMDLTIREISRVMKPGGRVIMVVGESTMQGVLIRNSKAMIHIGKAYGLVPKTIRTRKLPPSRRYLPPPSSLSAGPSLGSRMKEEVILTMRKQ